MVYIFVLCGFMMGFGIGLGTLNVMLRHRSKKEIKEDASLKWYGLVAWGFALCGGVLGYWVYQHNFL